MKWLFGGVLALVGLIALVLVAGYFVLKRDDVPYETLAARYESAASRYVDLPSGVRMHYRDEGQATGPTLLLIHGFSASLHTWEPWVQRLGDEYRVITLDLPGHGLTRAPAGYQASIEAFRDAGGGAIEVFTGSHSRVDFERYAAVSKKFSMPASRGSDFHDPLESHYDIGGLPPMSDDLMPVWWDWPELCHLQPAFV